MTVSARCAKALTGINPQRVFSSFLRVQKGTRPAGRSRINTKKVGATENVTPTFHFITGAEAKRSFAQSSFAYFSFKKSKLQVNDFTRENFPAIHDQLAVPVVHGQALTALHLIGNDLPADEGLHRVLEIPA